MSKIGSATKATRDTTPKATAEKSKPSKATSKPKVDSTRDAAPTESASSRVSDRTRAAARTMVHNDATAQQLRARTEGQVSSDAPGSRAEAARGAAAARSKRAFSLEGPKAAGAATPAGGTVPATGASGSPAAAIAGTEGFSRNSDGSYTFQGTTGDDTYTVSQNAAGDLTVRNEGSGTDFTLAAADTGGGVQLLGNDGDDQFTIDASVNLDLQIEGGRGDDNIDGRQAQGDLRIHGGSGDDILRGGDGNDEIIGGIGQDRLYGGAGADSLQGNGGDDRLWGGEGNDQLIGHSGDDILNGGAGDDFIIGRQGADRLNGGTGSDAIYADADDTRVSAGSVWDNTTRTLQPDSDVDLIVAEDGAPATTHAGADDVTATYDRTAVDDYLRAHPELVINGDPTFRERVRADLGVMLGTAQGRGLLDDLTAAAATAGETVTLEENPVLPAAPTHGAATPRRPETGQQPIGATARTGTRYRSCTTSWFTPIRTWCLAMLAGSRPSRRGARPTTWSGRRSDSPGWTRAALSRDQEIFRTQTMGSGQSWVFRNATATAASEAHPTDIYLDRWTRSRVPRYPVCTGEARILLS